MGMKTLIKRSFSTRPKKTVEDAFTQRLTQLKEQQITKDDVLLGKKFQSLMDQDNELKKFQYEHQRSIQTAKLPLFISKNDKANAQHTPWTGQEHQSDSTLRMLVDKHKPLKGNQSVKKLANAKETVLDYKINKKSGEDEDASFRNIYKEKFTPIGSFDKIKTLADARIEEAMRQGQFNNIPRGEKLDVDVKAYVDRTEHHLNNLLIKQNIVPPWIEKQGGVNGEINTFRKELNNKWKSHIILFYHTDQLEMRRSFLKKWEVEYENKLKLLNNSIRTYNLQAPLSTQKFYLLYDKEIDKCFNEIDVKEVRKEEEEKEKKKKKQSKLKERSTSISNSFNIKNIWNWTLSDKLK